jgi:hypothetical protein
MVNTKNDCVTGVEKEKEQTILSSAVFIRLVPVSLNFESLYQLVLFESHIPASFS